MKKLSAILLLGLLICLAGCSSLFFYPQKEHFDNPALKSASYEDVYFMTSDGLRLHGWYLKAKDKSHGTILHLHGNAENVSSHVNSVLWLTHEGYDVFTFDYRGYGRSEGSPDLRGVHRDAQAALETVLKQPGINKERLFILGQSLGGAISVYTAANSPDKNHIKALIIDSAFSSYRTIAREKIAQFILTWPFQYPLSLFFNDYYSPVKWIKNVHPIPVLIIQGDEDVVVPVHHASILYEKASYPKELWVVNGVGHIQAFAVEDIRKRFLTYLEGIK
jgi:fermentation-respiration switch protein FrsA (DUF1100 family)